MDLIITVEVTEADIAAGERGIPAQCPYALAAKRAFGKPATVCVSTDAQCEGHLYYLRCGTIGHFLTGDDVRRIDEYDRTGKMKPTKFTVPLV